MLATPPVRAMDDRLRPVELCAERADRRPVLQQITNQITSFQNGADAHQSGPQSGEPAVLVAATASAVRPEDAAASQAQNIAFDVQQIDQAFQTKYGRPRCRLDQQQLIADAKPAGRTRSAVAGRHARCRATVVGNIDTNRTQMSALVGASQSATGALQATQAGNQLLALQAQQLADLTAVIAANGRAQALTEPNSAAPPPNRAASSAAAS